MRIGIDIDDTLTEVKDKLNRAAIDYAKKLGKNIPKDIKTIDDKTNDGNIYQKVLGYNYEELKYFLKDIQESIINNSLPRENAVEMIQKLKNDGHEIIIITARDSEFHDDPYKMSKEWLDTNNIYYDKLIVNARNKKIVCKQEKVDILIDDSLANCLNVSEVGVKPIRICKEANNSNIIPSFDNWLDIYQYIKNQLEDSSI